MKIKGKRKSTWHFEYKRGIFSGKSVAKDTLLNVREGRSLLNARWMDLFSAVTLTSQTRSQNWMRYFVLSESRKTSNSNNQ